MEELDKINWSVILWVAGGIGTFFLLVISSLLGWIGVMHRETKEAIIKKNVEQDERLEKHDDKFEKVQDEVHQLALSVEKTLTMVKIKYKIK